MTRVCLFYTALNQCSCLEMDHLKMYLFRAKHACYIIEKVGVAARGRMGSRDGSVVTFKQILCDICGFLMAASRSKKTCIAVVFVSVSRVFFWGSLHISTNKSSTALKIDMEPKNDPTGRENRCPNLHLGVPALHFLGCTGPYLILPS